MAWVLRLLFVGARIGVVELVFLIVRVFLCVIPFSFALCVVVRIMIALVVVLRVVDGLCEVLSIMELVG